MKIRFWLMSLTIIALAGCSGSSAPPTNDAGGVNAAATTQKVTNEYPAQLLGKFSDRPCAEANAIQQAADLWPGFEIKKFERAEMALLCAATSVREAGGAFEIAETCLVRQANQQALRSARYELKGDQLTVTVDGKSTKLMRCS